MTMIDILDIDVQLQACRDFWELEISKLDYRPEPYKPSLMNDLCEFWACVTGDSLFTYDFDKEAVKASQEHAQKISELKRQATKITVDIIQRKLDLDDISAQSSSNVDRFVSKKKFHLTDSDMKTHRAERVLTAAINLGFPDNFINFLRNQKLKKDVIPQNRTTAEVHHLKL